MPKVLSYEAVVRGGLTAQNKLVVPVQATDPAAPGEGWVWLNTTENVLRYRSAGVTVDLNEIELDAEGVRDVIATALGAGTHNNVAVTYNDAGDAISLSVTGLDSTDISDFVAAVRAAISVTDSATLDLTVTGGQISGTVLDSPTVGGRNTAYLLSTDNHVDGVTNHVFTAADDTKLAGIATGATANDTNANLRNRATHTGEQPASSITNFAAEVRGQLGVADGTGLDLTYTTATGVFTGAVTDSPLLGGNNPAYYRNTDNHVDGTVNHVFTAADDTKLTGIATGATKNATDEALRDRGSHTGEQPASSITNFAGEVTTVVGGLAIDAATVNGQTASQIQTAVTSAIVDAAPGTLDTLNELAAALGDDPNFATTITNALNARSRNFAAALVGGSATEVVTHNLNTRDLVVQVYNAAGDFEQEEYIVRHTTVNTVTIVSEGVNIPAGRRVVIHAVGNAA